MIMRSNGELNMKIPPKYPHAYSKDYLKPTQDLHCLLYKDFIENEKYDFFSLIDSYMQTSKIKEKMDEGNWSALNKGDKQLLNSIDFSKCQEKKSNSYIVDIIVARWMANIYTLFQWKYNISSKELNRILPSKTLYELFNPLHETSLDNACEKIVYKYFPQLMNHINEKESVDYEYDK